MKHLITNSFKKSTIGYLQSLFQLHRSTESSAKNHVAVLPLSPLVLFHVVLWCEDRRENCNSNDADDQHSCFLSSQERVGFQHTQRKQISLNNYYLWPFVCSQVPLITYTNYEVHLQNAWVQLKMSNMVVCLWCSYWTGSALSAWRCFCEQIGKERDDINWWCRWSKLTVSLKVTCSIQRITYTPGSRPGNLKVEYCPSLYGINNGLYLPLLCRGGSLRLVLRTTGLFLDICCHFSAGENHWEHLWYLKGTNA